MNLLKIIIILISIITLNLNAQDTIRVFDLNRYFDECQLSGSFVLYDLNLNTYHVYNQEHAQKRFMPASTFKILNSLISLETGAIKDENEIIEWDGTKRSIESWNQNHNLESAFKNSVVWFYQELARRVGSEKMKNYVEQCHYGNQNIEGGIDSFWLDGELRISTFEQIEFLKKFYIGELPFQKKITDLVKKIMMAEKTDSYTIYAKTGWAIRDDYTGWYVGFVETKGKAYIFATCVEGKGKSDSDFMKCRIEITKNILKYFDIIK
jgi:beta-lactamase class D